MKKIFFKILNFKLKILAKITVKLFKPFIIAITGSAGKTSAKEAIYAVLKDYKKVRKSPGNFNSEFGVPLTILGDFSEADLNLFSLDMPPGANRFKKFLFLSKVILNSFIRLFYYKKSLCNYPEVIILEYGADKPKDIEKLIKIAKPNIGIITAIGEIPVHVEFYQSIEGVVKEKSTIISNLSSSDLAVINLDDFWASNLKKRTRSQVKTFGFSPEANIRITHFSHTYFDSSNRKIRGINFKLEKEGSFVPVEIDGVFSLSHAYAAACAATVGDYFGINLVSISESLSKNYSPAAGRSLLLKGIKDTQIVDESYNSSPLALKTALETLKFLPKLEDRRRVAILGDMTELGDYTKKAHEMIGEIIPECVDFLITIGEKAKIFSKKTKAISFENVSQALEEIDSLLSKGDLVIVKASHSLGLNKIVEKIKVEN